MAKTGKGAEGVSRNLNKYFQMMVHRRAHRAELRLTPVRTQKVKIISGGGGDVLKFAGDAMIVLWPDDNMVRFRVWLDSQRGASARGLVGTDRHSAASRRAVCRVHPTAT
jgi:hypothetical protein